MAFRGTERIAAALLVCCVGVSAQDSRPSAEVLNAADRRLNDAYEASASDRPGLFVRAAFADAATLFREVADDASAAVEHRRRAWLGAGDASAGAGDVDGAVSAYDAAAALGGGFEADLRAARALLDAGRRAACLARLETALEAEDESVRASALFLAIEARLDDGDRVGVRALLLGPASELSDENRAACWDLTASRLREAGGDAFLTETIEAALAEDANDARALFWRGDAALRSRSFARALKVFRAYRTLRPDSFDARYWTAIAEGRAGLLDAAKVSIAGAVEIAPTPAAAAPGLREIAFLLYTAKRYDDAAELQAAAAEGTGLFTDALDHGALLHDAGRASEAIARYRELIKRDDVAGPDRAKAWNFLGLAMRGIGDDAEAESCFKAAIAAWDDERDARENLGVLLIETGRADLARPYLEWCVSRESGRFRSRYHLFRLDRPKVDGRISR